VSNRDRQNVSGLAEQQTKLYAYGGAKPYGYKSTAIGTVCFDTQLKFLDTMFAVTSALNIEVGQTRLSEFAYRRTAMGAIKLMEQMASR
jgi:hypothetical protein